MRKILSRFVALTLMATAMMNVNAQKNNPVMFEIGGQKIYQSEFRSEFLRSIGKDTTLGPTACTYEKRQALEEYVQLFVNYRVKLLDAKAQGLDTIPSLQRELAMYRTELASPYLIDSTTLSQIFEEAYERNKYAVHAAHILIKCDKNASTQDTLEAYNKAMEVYRLATGDSADFTSLAIHYSDDPSAKGRKSEDGSMKGNGGDLGYFTVFSMVYPFETACYTMSKGEVSKPVRTQFGYHIIKLLDKIPFYGASTIQHIWVSTARNPEYAKVKINDAFSKLQEGEDFSSVAQNYSDDRSTASNGGLIPNATIEQLPAEYISIISQLNPGEICFPIQTIYGWHIVKLLQKDSIPAMEQLLPMYKQRMMRDQRNTKPRAVFAEQCKQRYDFHDYTTEVVATKGKKQKNAPLQYKANLDQAIEALNDSIFRKKWQFEDQMITDVRPIMSIGDKQYTQRDLLLWMASNQEFIRWKGDITAYTNTRYKEFCNEMAIAFADSQLEKEQPDFRKLLNEYRNGLMIFAYNDKMIWSKAILDTVGIEEYYQANSSKRSLDDSADAQYFWNTRANVTIYTVSDSAIASPEKVMKVIAQANKKGWSKGLLNETLNEMAAKAKKVDHAKITSETQIVEQEHQNTLKNNEWQKGMYVHPLTKGYQVLVVEKLTDPALKTVKEARGYYINDYQNYLDQQLIQELRAKYNVVIHQDVIDNFTY